MQNKKTFSTHQEIKKADNTREFAV